MSKNIAMFNTPTDPSMEYISLILDYLSKPFFFKSGSLLLFAILPSFSLMHLFEIVVADTELRSLILPLSVFCILLLVYIVISVADFFTGLSASKKEHTEKTGSPKGYIETEKLWFSVWKFFGVLMISTVLTIFSIIFAVLDKGFYYSIFLYAIVFFFIIVILFDLHSIGENQERKFGKKPRIYNFIEDVSDAIKNGIIKKIGKYFE